MAFLGESLRWAEPPPNQLHMMGCSLLGIRYMSRLRVEIGQGPDVWRCELWPFAKDERKRIAKGYPSENGRLSR